MADPARFLHALGRALELRLRPGADAAARRAADEACAARLTELLASGPLPAFHFTATGVRYGALPLAGFEEWIWSEVLASQGVVRLELIKPPEPAVLAAFLDLAAGLLPAEAPVPRDALRWSTIGIDLPLANDDYPLDEARAVVRQCFQSAEKGEPIRLGDVNAVVAALGATLGGSVGAHLPLLHLQSREGYQVVHAINTALLAMAVAEALRLGGEERRECGIAALLHDIGMVRLPAEASAERFSSQDRARVRGHPLEGARLLLRQGEMLEGAAVVSYEHHLRQDGSGYPRLSYPREPHMLSRIVAVCDAFDALLAPRPDRQGFDPLGALREIERSAVTQFDPRVVGAFSEVIVRSAGRNGLVLTLRQN